jgi:hypothetical protein
MSSLALECSEISKGGVLLWFNTSRDSTHTSTAPVGRFGFSVPAGTGFHFARHFNHEFPAQSFPLGKHLFAVRVKHELNQSFPIPKIHKNHAPVVPPVMHPPGQNNLFSHMFRPNLATIDGAFHKKAPMYVLNKFKFHPGEGRDPVSKMSMRKKETFPLDPGVSPGSAYETHPTDRSLAATSAKGISSWL